jgi:7-cyano-7-deazaguanine synthase
MELVLEQATAMKINIHCPLMYKTKAESVMMATKLEGCMSALSHTHTCYNGVYPPCGKCHACLLRARGFDEAGIGDPLLANLKFPGVDDEQVVDKKSD